MIKVIDASVAKAYGGKRKISWMEIYAGEKSTQVYGPDVWLPEETLKVLKDYVVSIKGPLTTPVGCGTVPYSHLNLPTNFGVCVSVWRGGGEKILVGIETSGVGKARRCRSEGVEADCPAGGGGFGAWLDQFWGSALDAFNAEVGRAEREDPR